MFDYKPKGKWLDWSKGYSHQLGRLQAKIDMKAKERSTAYSFRHTFTDELKPNDVEESLVAQIVEHRYKGITFGRYGKNIQ
ncbi:hypothetical protein LRP50_20625 [Enterovibrio sp. ZSDZ42]|uniref:Integrase n=1 Tax=Enterovibrio gelatinilyticus TaxID=2899819 RepID=A0ABT5R6Z4_9GAMM|nr:hypothetical protein [Enterovibrio sp. ZSDZ42]MDD1795536.1 hypothetical protein [Enterovibrio sp. ZSDZ42]